MSFSKIENPLYGISLQQVELSFPQREPNLSKIQEILLFNLRNQIPIEEQKNVCFSIICNQLKNFQWLQLEEITDEIVLLVNNLSTHSILQESFRKRQNENPLQVGKLLNDIGAKLFFLNQYSAAIKYFEDAIEIFQTSSDEIVHIINSMNNLALTFRKLKKYKKAKRLYCEALNMLKTKYGEKHLLIANIMNNLALVEGLLGNKETELDLHSQILQIRKELLGEEHEDIANSLNNSGVCLIFLKRYEEAEFHLRQALILNQRLLGENHPETLNTLNNLAMLLNAKDQYREGEIELRKCLKLCEKANDKEQLNIYILTIYNLASNLFIQKKLEEAKDLLKKSIQILEQTDKLETLEMFNHLALLLTVLSNQNNLNEAENVAIKLINICKILQDKNSEIFADVKSLLIQLNPQFNQ